MNRLLFFGCLALVSAALIGGFMVAGGPQYARMEEDDRQRAQDLRDWGRYYACHTGTEKPLSERCSGQGRPPDSRDPETDAPYRYTILDDQTFEVCATFRTVELSKEPVFINRSLVFSGDEGCLRYKLTEEDGDWVLQ